MSTRRFALIDPAAGVSGDMLLGALVDLGIGTAGLESLPARLGLADVRVEFADVMRAGMRATKVTVVGPGGAIEGPSDVLDHAHDDHHHGPGSDHQHHDHHHHDHPHHHIGELLAMIARADLSPRVKEQATRAFRLLGEAEAKIHGIPFDQVALHEVGSADALVDIVGVIEGFEMLGVAGVYTRPVAVGQGWVRAAHGRMPVPAPATALLLEGLPIAPNGPVTGEATTPTGATLLRTLVTGPMPDRVWHGIRTGFGAGGRSPTAYANTLRIVLGEFDAAPADQVVALVTDLDDFNPEYLEPLRDALTTAGALDVQCWMTMAKKGRVSLRVEVQAPEGRAESVTTALFRHTTTGGVRQSRLERSTLERDHWSFTDSAGDTVRVKTLWGPDGPRVKPEFDDVAAIARRTGISAHDLFRRIQDEALHSLRQARTDDAAIAHPKES